jgi:hypothetical protein
LKKEPSTKHRVFHGLSRSGKSIESNHLSCVDYKVTLKLLLLQVQTPFALEQNGKVEALGMLFLVGSSSVLKNNGKKSIEWGFATSSTSKPAFCAWCRASRGS